VCEGASTFRVWLSLVLGDLAPCAQRIAGRFVSLHGKLFSLSVI